MDAKKIALLVGALFVAAVTAIMAKSMLGSGTAVPRRSSPPPCSRPARRCWSRPRRCPIGTILGPDAIRFQPWPKELVDGAYYVRGQDGADPVKMQGMVVRSDISAGQPVTQGALVSPQGSRLPRRGADAGHARRHHLGGRRLRGRRLRLPG